jgi:hypothetical protein
MSRANRMLHAACVLLALTAPAARAQVTADQASVLAQQIRDWVGSWNAGTFDPAALPIAVTAEGERYRISMAPPAVTGVAIAGDGISTFATPLDGGRWALEDLRWPSRLDLSWQPARKIALTIDEQATQGVFDPSLSTESSMQGRFRGVSYRVDGPDGVATARFKAVSTHTIWQPQGDGLVTMLSQTDAEGYENSRTVPNGAPVSVAIDRLHVSSRADRTDFAQLGGLVRGVASMIAAARSVGPPPPAGPQREALQAMATTLGNLAANVDVEETAEGVRLHAAGYGGRIARLELAGGIGAPDGAAQLYMRLAFDGLASDDIPEGPFRQLLPRRLLLTPRISGVSKEGLQHFIHVAIDAAGTPGADPGAAGLALLAASPATVAIDELALDAGPASLTGTMEVEVKSRSDIAGTAELRMTGLDALIALVASAPQFRQAMPVLILLKGIGQQEGRATVWKVAYANRKMTVNGTDMAALMPRR